MSRFTYTTEMDQFIRDNYQLVSSALANQFNQRFGTSKSSNQLSQARKSRGLKTGRSGCFQKGMAPNSGSFKKGKTPNATSFQKGRRPHNYIEIGKEIQRGDGYIWVKIADPNVWKQKHIMNWEAQNGELKKGQILWFIDEDRTNCEVDNLELGTLSENVRRNKLRLSSQPAELKETSKLVAKLQDITGKLNRDNDNAQDLVGGGV